MKKKKWEDEDIQDKMDSNEVHCIRTGLNDARCRDADYILMF